MEGAMAGPWRVPSLSAIHRYDVQPNQAKKSKITYLQYEKQHRNSTL